MSVLHPMQSVRMTCAPLTMLSTGSLQVCALPHCKPHGGQRGLGVRLAHSSQHSHVSQLPPALHRTTRVDAHLGCQQQTHTHTPVNPTLPTLAHQLTSRPNFRKCHAAHLSNPGTSSRSCAMAPDLLRTLGMALTSSWALHTAIRVSRSQGCGVRGI